MCPDGLKMEPTKTFNANPFVQRSGVRTTHYSWNDPQSQIHATYAFGQTPANAAVGDSRDWADATELDEVAIEGRQVFEPEMTLTMAETILRDKVRRHEEATLSKWLKHEKWKADLVSAVKILKCDIKVTNVEVVHVPVYVARYNYLGQSYDALIAADGGRSHMPRHYSLWPTASAAAAVTSLGLAGPYLGAPWEVASAEQLVVPAAFALFFLHSQAANREFLTSVAARLDSRYEEDMSEWEKIQDSAKQQSWAGQDSTGGSDRQKRRVRRDGWADFANDGRYGDPNERQEARSQYEEHVKVEVRSNLDVLGITNKQATPEEIKQAYLKLVKQYHPDLARGGVDRVDREAKFKEITQAYESLKEGILFEEASSP